MKAYTDINQSKQLAEILPIESADMYYPNRIDIKYQGALPIEYKHGNPLLSQEIAAWSLAALLEIIRKPTACDLLINGRGYRCHCTDKSEGKFYGTKDYCDDAIDACIKVIIKLNEQKLL